MIATDERTVDSSIPIYDRETGAIHFLYQTDYARCFYLRSEDEGETFSEPVEITATFEAFRDEYPWRVFAPGPGHALQMDTGRLVIPVWLSTGTSGEFGPEYRGHRPSVTSVIFSDDHGATWNRGEIAAWNTERVVNPNETVAVQLQDGKVLLNMRTETPRNRRAFTFSEDGATAWTDPEFQDELFDPVCMGSMIRLPDEFAGGKSCLLFVNPDSSHLQSLGNRHNSWPRENLTLRASFDEGKTWPVKRLLDPGQAGYSDLAVGPDGTIYCFYEHGGQTDDRGMSVLRFDYSWIAGSSD